MRIFGLSLVLAFAAIASCRSGHTSAPAAPRPTASADVPSDHYYAGTSIMTMGGRHVGETKVLAKRTLDPSSSTITEEVISEDGRSGKASVYVVVMAVNGATFTMTEASGAFEGKGTLSGAPWQWTSWESTSTMPDGGLVTSKDSLTTDGLRVTKTYAGQGIEVFFEETFQEVRKEEYELAKKTMLAK